MKIPSLLSILRLNCIALLTLLLAGCASDRQQAVSKPIEHPKPPENAKAATVHCPLGNAHTSAENSLAVSGFKVVKTDDVFIEAHRPHHIGLFVGSGGEVCRVWLKPVAADETEVKVDSMKTVMGILGQKEWDNIVLAEIVHDLNK